MAELKVGQKIYLEPYGNAARRWDGVLKTDEVVDVKRKYAYTKRGDRVEISRMMIDGFNSGYTVYTDPIEYELKKERINNISEIQKVFSVYGNVNVSLEQSRLILNILKTK